MTAITVMSNKFVRGWPTHDDGERVYVLDLGKALEREYRTDAHIATYRTPNGRRLTREAIDAGLSIEIGAVFLDFDCAETHGTAEPASEAWRRSLREKVIRLFGAHGVGYFYETRGGARVVFRLNKPTIIRSHGDAREWSQSYAVLLANLSRRFDLHADAACNDWQRLFRAPHATRTEGGKPENWPTFGDAENIAPLFVEATTDDVAAAKKATTAFRCRREPRPATSAAGGDGLLYHLLRLRGEVDSQETSRGGWICLCPNRARHSKNSD
jgi:hypothetical protein